MDRITGSVPAVLSRAVVMIAFLCHGVCWMISSAQQADLPPEFFTDSVIGMMRQHFCANECLNQCEGNRICWHLNHENICQQKRCWKNKDMNMCEEVGQIPFCGYNDAVVCQLKRERGYCVFSTSASIPSPFCTCRDSVDSLSTSTQQSNYCEEDKSEESTTSNPVPETTRSLATTFTTKCQPATTTPRGTATSRPAGGSGGSSGPVNIAATVLGVVLSLVLVGIILVLFLWRRGKRNSRRSPGDESIVMAPTRAKLPDPPIPSSADEYSYAYGHCSQPGETSDITDGEDHFYSKLAQEGDRQVSSCHSRDASGATASERDLTTVAANEHQYLVLDGQGEDGAVVDASARGTMVTEKCPGGSGEDYTCLNEGVVAGSSDDGVSASPPYEHLSRAAGKRMNDGALSKNQDDDYQHLMGNVDYDHLKH